ncbi:MAG: helix-turn-helix transcriptional regulator [Woeseiaceae bacterium]
MASDTAFEASRPITEIGVAPFGTQRPAKDRSLSHRLLLPVFAFQMLSCLFFVGELWTEVLGIRTSPIPYHWQEIIEILASVGLIFGVVTTSLLLRGSQRRISKLGRQMDVARGNYETHLNRQFAEWDLTPSEQDVTIYAMKGFSNAEVAALRGTSAATVKSQLNAVYRKSEFANRQQLISFLVEELLSGVAVDSN